MEKMKIVLGTNPILYKKSNRIEKIDESVEKLAENMLNTMYLACGVGLAGIQVGVPQRIVVMDTESSYDGEKLTPKNPIVMINPEVLELSKEMEEVEEGCLSFPGIFLKLQRPNWVKVKYTDLDGKEHTEKYSGLLGQCTQHEVEHLEGETLADSGSRLKKEVILKKLKKRFGDKKWL